MSHRLTHLAATTGAAILAAGLVPSAAAASPVIHAPASRVIPVPMTLTQNATDTAAAEISYPKRQHGWRPVTYTWTVWRSYVFKGQALVLYTDINRQNVSQIRFTKTIPNATCGVHAESTDYNIYCIVHRPEQWTRFSMQFKVWPRRISSLTAAHYWGGVESGGRVADYIDQLGPRNWHSLTTTSFYN